MKIDIRGVYEAGNLEKERIVLRANSEIDIGRFILSRNSYIADGAVHDKMRNAFWLPDQNVEAGHLVVIYTKNGENRVRVNKDGSKTHFIYSGLTQPIWSSEDAIVLFEIASWEMKKVS
jgi:hypothetical protein